MATPDAEYSQEAVEILIALSSPDITTQTSGLHRVMSTGVSWDDILQLAGIHQVQPLLYRSVKSADPQLATLSEIQMASLRQQCRNIKMHNLRVETELHRVSGLLDEAKVPHIIYKGPALARQVFGDLGLRQFNDYDLLAKREDALRIQGLLENLGYTSIVPMNRVQRKKLWYFEKEITYIRPETGQRRHEADVHWMLLRPALSVPLQFETLWNQRMLALLGTKECVVLNQTYTFLSTCIHNGGNEGWSTLKQVADVDAILRQWHTEIDWKEVWRAGEQYDLGLLIAVALLLAHKTFGSPIPDEVFSKANTLSGANEIAEALRLFPHPQEQRHWPAVRRHLTMRRSPLVKAKVVAKSVLEWLAPNYADEQFLPLPGAGHLYGFYYLVRPFRVLFAGRNADRFGS